MRSAEEDVKMLAEIVAYIVDDMYEPLRQRERTKKLKERDVMLDILRRIKNNEP